MADKWVPAFRDDSVVSRRARNEAALELKVFALTCGHLTGDLGHLMEGGEGRVRVPIPAYLIEHPKGTAVFDTGMHPDCQHDPAARVGMRMTGLFEFDYHPGEEINYRNYRTMLHLAGAKKGDYLQETDTISRMIYGLSTAYMMTGEEPFVLAPDAKLPPELKKAGH